MHVRFTSSLAQVSGGGAGAINSLGAATGWVTLCWALTPTLAKGIPALTLPSGALQWKGLLDVEDSAAVSQELSGAGTA